VFDISFTELMLIGVVALVIIGPERLPKLARTVGHLLGRAQRYVNDVKGDIQREVELEELRKMKEEMESAASSMQNSFTQAESSLRDSIHEPISDLQPDSEPKQNPSIELPQQQPEDDVKGAMSDSAERKQ